MLADDDEITACIALSELRGKRHRSEEDESSGSSPPPKIQKVAAASRSQHGTPRNRITKANIEAVRDQLSQLTLKNQEIRSSMHELRKSVVEDLHTHMKVRRMALSQMGRQDIEDELRSLCLEALPSRKALLVSKEEELLSLERLMAGHAAVLDFADLAYQELLEKIHILDTCAFSGLDPGLSILDFPQMSALARLTGGDKEGPEAQSVLDIYQDDSQPFSTFTNFTSLPPEIRLLIWRASLPRPRIITHHSKHNRNLVLLGVCRESRIFVISEYPQILSPTQEFPTAVTPILYVNRETDTVVRDLTIYQPRSPDHPTRRIAGPSLFEMPDDKLNKACFRIFSGLSRVKHLALAFDLLRENGGVLFGTLQACCPELRSLILFPSSQVGSRKHPKASNLKFFDLDSNLIDYISFRWDVVHDKTLKRKALRGLATLLTLLDHAGQYLNVFPSYVTTYGQQWTPTIRVCLLARWIEPAQAWQTRLLDGDHYSRGFISEDGRPYRGFVESLKIADADGELLSRYDGMARLFGDGKGT